ncbi:MAG: YIP1 family protein [Tannerellaceae bacterium]|jgi:hypothetical protein|nr:YIP1 family protein [Tannerellaceae bacterium]
MYKEIFKLVALIISHPGRAWMLLTEKGEERERVLSRFVYPLIGMVTLSAFLGVLLPHNGAGTEAALKAAIRELTAAFGGFFLTAYVLNELGVKLFHREKDIALWQKFTGYSSGLMYVLKIILALVPDLFFLQAFLLYTFYIVWEGAKVYMSVEKEDDRLRFTGVVTLVILIAPWLVEAGLCLLMPGLKS